MVHHLQQHVEDVGVRLLDFVEQQHGVRMLADRVDQQPALFEADVSRRRADEPGDRVLLHVLAHVEADELVAEVQRQLFGELGLADAGRTREEKTAGGPVRLSEPGARSLDGARHRADGLFLTEDHASERFLQRSQPVAVRRRRLLGGNARDARDDVLDLADADLDDLLIAGPALLDGLARLPQAHARTGLVEHVDGAVGQLVVAHVTRRQLRPPSPARRR